MDTTTSQTPATPANEELIRELYGSILHAWNQRDADGFAFYFAEDGVIIGFDGTVVETRAAIAHHLGEIFANREPPVYVQIIKSVRFHNDDTALLLGIAGMPSLLTGKINPTLNSMQSLVVVRSGETWRIALFQNTPAQLHGRPDLVERMSEELQRQIDG